MKANLLFSVVFLCLVMLSSCGEQLNETELEIINKDIPLDLYQQSSIQSAESLDDYLFEGLQEYANAQKSQVQREIQEHKRSVAMFGDWDIGSAVFGEPSKEDKLISKYNSYIDYANRNRKKIYDIILGITQIIAQNPTVLSNLSGNSQNVNLEFLSRLELVPISLSRDSYDKYFEIPFSNADAIKWGEAILPFSKTPTVQYDALTVAVIKMMEGIKYPKPIYALYNNESKSWIVGYDTEQAVEISFVIDHEVENWEMEEIQYNSAYINSKDNVIKNK